MSEPTIYKAGQHIRIKLSGEKIELAVIRYVVETTNGIKLQCDFGHEQTALIELRQVVGDNAQK
jgi:hypothetical protein